MKNILLREAAAPAVTSNRETDSLGLYEQAASIVPMGAFSCNLADERLSWTGGVFDMFGLSGERPPERQATVEMYTEASRALLGRKRSHAIATCSSFSLDANIIRPDGTERWIRINAAVRSVNGRAETLYGMKQDITEDHARWEILRAQAECDPLTGVANRMRFQRFLERPNDEPALGRIGALILFDLDGFKQINDRWGHAAGDACLVAFGERLKRAFPQARLVSRIGGDEFAVLLPPVGSASKTERDVRWLTQSLLSPVPWNGDRLPIGASVGIAFASRAYELDPQHLFVVADRNLYEAKKAAATGTAWA
ncbi:diguanylate cyclase [Pelagibacterium flavum]|uniref:Diguanylate cyclase n=1 Tax=Pelagibacterium flavum TaxID=2984530 RepID=A0ABY6IW43_9HYPH|nr:diguanylate cyclase [Pelagibacterium sp. YIM 151497]MAN75855.1 GGDEF domain-containing protein [Hyphomicrobiales bacterium]UYQ73644.1 diguanylate cyclase [Pelagibacterium sp. YIM 151497]|tara:strand:- start:3477 stop:4409 length:933 start_codon:yes stop_codon:yes gene_type:complete